MVYIWVYKHSGKTLHRKQVFFLRKIQVMVHTWNASTGEVETQAPGSPREPAHCDRQALDQTRRMVPKEPNETCAELCPLHTLMDHTHTVIDCAHISIGCVCVRAWAHSCVFPLHVSSPHPLSLLFWKLSFFQKSSCCCFLCSFTPA